MDNLKIEKAHIVGLSMGGFASLHFGINAPERAKSIVIAGCGYGAIPIDKTNYNDAAFQGSFIGYSTKYSKKRYG